MNHELVMLRGIPYCKKDVRRLTDECMRLALKSYSTEKWKNGTMGQMEKISHVAAERDKFVLYLELVGQALSDMPRGLSVLLFEVYVRRTPKEALCSKFGVSLSTVYRKVARARQCFKSRLVCLGCTEAWFEETYGQTEWVRALLDKRTNGSRLTE